MKQENLLASFLLTIIAIIFIIIFISPGGVISNIYPNNDLESKSFNESFKKGFMDGCLVDPKLEDYCECTYNYFIDNFGKEGTVKAGLEHMKSDEMTPKMEEAASACKDEL